MDRKWSTMKCIIVPIVNSNDEYSSEIVESFVGQIFPNHHKDHKERIGIALDSFNKGNIVQRRNRHNALIESIKKCIINESSMLETFYSKIFCYLLIHQY